MSDALLGVGVTAGVVGVLATIGAVMLGGKGKGAAAGACAKCSIASSSVKSGKGKTSGTLNACSVKGGCGSGGSGVNSCNSCVLPANSKNVSAVNAIRQKAQAGPTPAPAPKQPTKPCKRYPGVLGLGSCGATGVKPVPMPTQLNQSVALSQVRPVPASVAASVNAPCSTDMTRECSTSKSKQQLRGVDNGGVGVFLPCDLQPFIQEPCCGSNLSGREWTSDDAASLWVPVNEVKTAPQFKPLEDANLQMMGLSSTSQLEVKGCDLECRRIPSNRGGTTGMYSWTTPVAPSADTIVQRQAAPANPNMQSRFDADKCFFGQ